MRMNVESLRERGEISELESERIEEHRQLGKG